jgi:hypothetical protein
MRKKTTIDPENKRRLLSFAEVEELFGLGRKYLYKNRAALPGLVDIGLAGGRPTYRVPLWGVEKFLTRLRTRTRSGGGDGKAEQAEAGL